MSYDVFCANFSEEATISTGLVTLSISFFWKKQNDKLMDDYYSEFSRLIEELCQIISITFDVK